MEVSGNLPYFQQKSLSHYHFSTFPCTYVLYAV
nr:MAG TPA: hypothetical protein [Caudoviricetes sp.]